MSGLFEPVYGLLTLKLFILGALLGAFYDVFRIRRIAWFMPSGIKEKSEKQGLFQNFLNKVRMADTLLIFFEDILFAIVSSVAVIIMNYVINQGVVRAYSIICVGAGFLFYHLTLGRLVIKSAKAIIAFVRRLFSLFIKVTFLPFFRILKKPVLFISRKISEAKAISRTEKTKARIFSFADKAFIK